jgi:hypothetical protein
VKGIQCIWLLALSVGCGSSKQTTEGEEAVVSTLVSLRVEPAEVQLSTDGSDAGEIQFVAWATTDSGVEVETDMVSWTVSNFSAGSVDTNGLFTTSTLNGGVTTVTATHMEVEATATVTVVYEQDLLLDELGTDVIEAFDEADAINGEYPAIHYPQDGVTVPRNLNGLTFGWTVPSDSSTVSRLRLKSGITDMSVFTANSEWFTTSDTWATIAASNTEGKVDVTIESGTWDGTSLTGVVRGPDMTLTVNRLDARGSVLYWEPSAVDRSGDIMRIPFGSLEAEQFWSASDLGWEQNDNATCMGCHTLSEANDQLVVTHSGVNGQFSIVDISDPTNPEIEQLMPGNASFHTASPDGRYLLGVLDGEARLYSLTDGGFVRVIDTGTGRVSHPDWAPDGESVVMVRYQYPGFGVVADDNFEEAEVIQMDWNGTEFGAPEVLVASDPNRNNYYPAYSPDGDYIVFNRNSPRTWTRANGGTLENSTTSYAHIAAELWIMTRDGEYLTRLDAANGVGDLQNSYPKWGPLPDDDVLWLAFSSTRSYTIEPNGGTPQVWVSAIDPAKIMDGEDPSSPAFWLPAQNTDTDNHAAIWWSK